MNPFSLTWQPDLGLWGITPMIAGSLQSACLAWLIAMPWAVGLSAAVWVWPTWGRLVTLGLRGWVGIPSLLYGFFSVCIWVELLRTWGTGSGYSWLVTSLTLALLILPPLSLCLLEGWRQLSASMWRTASLLGYSPLERTRMLLPALLPSVRQGGALALGRALGDCMIALFVSGNIPQLTVNPLEGIRTLPAHMVLTANMEATSRGFASIFYGAGVLALLSMGLPKVCMMAMGGKRGCFSIPSRWIWSLFVPGSLGLFLIACLGMGGYIGYRVLQGIFVALSSPLPFLPIWLTPLLTSLWLGIWVVGIVIAGGIGLTMYMSTLGSRSIAIWESGLQLLGGLPSILIGFLGVMVLWVWHGYFGESARGGMGLAVVCLSLLTLPTMVHVLRAGLAQLPLEWKHTCRLLGYSPRWMWMKILLPALRPSLITGSLLVFLRAFEDTAVCLLTGAVAFAAFPTQWGEAFSPLSFQLFFLADQYRNEGELAQLYLVSGIWIAMAWGILALVSRFQRRFL